MNRISTTFQQLQANKRKALIPYLMAGFPKQDSTVPLMLSSVEAGADLIELGIPYSDPMADGPVVQQAAERAIANGVGVTDVFATVRQFRNHNQSTPVVLMCYANSVESYNLQHGASGFVDGACAAGVDGVLVVDYPPEECTEFSQALRKNGMDQIFLLAPTSSNARIEQVAQLASGYVYYVSLKGVTGSAALDTADVARSLLNIRKHVRVPIGVGFGIHDAAGARKVAEYADAVIIGSKLLQLIATTENNSDAELSIPHNPITDFLQGIRFALDA